MVGRTEYFVETSVTGGVRLNVSSPRAHGTGVMYSGSVNGGSVTIVDSVVTVTGLNYTQSHSLNVTANSSLCSGLVSAQTVDITFDVQGIAWSIHHMYTLLINCMFIVAI